jgi:hypothetical protein
LLAEPAAPSLATAAHALGGKAPLVREFPAGVTSFTFDHDDTRNSGIGEGVAFAKLLEPDMIPAPSLCQPATGLVPHLYAMVAETWRTVKNDLFDPYRPELHYMRGPGPKWRAKHPGMAPAGFGRIHGGATGLLPRISCGGEPPHTRFSQAAQW